MMKRKRMVTEYSWRRKDDFSRDLCVYEITKSTQKVPFTVIIFHYSERGDAPLFPALFWSNDWDEGRGLDGNVTDDVQFCISFWKHLGLEKVHGPFKPCHIEHDLTCTPPSIYRNTLEKVMDLRFGNGNVVTIPLDLSINMSEQDVEAAIMKGIEKSL